MITYGLATCAGWIASLAGLEVAWDSMEGVCGALLGVWHQVVADAINIIFGFF